MYRWEGLIKEYREFLPVDDNTKIITLNEGNTPLIRAENLEKKIGADFEIYLKYEGLNPTGSFKDRGMTMAVTKAVNDGSQSIMCASTGNTSASAAAYGAKAGLKVYVLVPNKKIAMGKLAQAIVYGAKIIAIDGNFDTALNLVRELTEKLPITLVNSINPYRIEGQKTGAFEIWDQLGCPPDYHFIPVGNAGNITAYWKGYKEYSKFKKIKKLPKMMGFQAEGSAPIVEGRIIDKPETIATAIRIGNPASWKGAENARDESHGAIDKVSDAQILEAYHMLASCEGIFAEPGSCASVAGLIKYSRMKLIVPGTKAVCILTGNGLKDPDTAIMNGSQPVLLPADYKALEKEILS